MVNKIGVFDADLSITTWITNYIKRGTFHYHAQTVGNGVISIGNVCSSYIEFDYYLESGVTINKGDELNYVQSVDVDKTFNPATARDIYTMPSFYVTSAKKSNKLCHVIAYDCVSWFDVDYSERLKALKASFPMTINDLFTDILSYCGVTSSSDISYFSATVGAVTVNYFYADGITARKILSDIVMLVGRTVFATSRTSITFSAYDSVGNITAWNSVKTYIICPDDGSYTQEDGTTPATNVWYKQGSLEIGNIVSEFDGAVLMLNDGTVLGSYGTVTADANVFYVTDNIILENSNISSSAAITSAIICYQQTNYFLTPYSRIRVSLFPFRNPFEIGTVARLVDSDGDYFYLPIMSLDLTDSSVTIESYGLGDDGELDSDYYGGESGLSAQINELKSMVNPLRTDTLTDTTNAYGNIFTTLDENCTILSAIRTGNTASICTPFWNESTGVWGIHVAGMGGAAVTSTSVTVKIAYFEG